jgi:hypothetical protein
MPRATSALFSVCFVSTDRVLGKEATKLLEKRSALFVETWGKPYFSEVCEYADARMSIAIIVSATPSPLSLRISHPHEQNEQTLPKWEDKFRGH